MTLSRPLCFSKLDPDSEEAAPFTLFVIEGANVTHILRSNVMTELCQRCKSKPVSAGGHQACMTNTPGETHERHFALCTDCNQEMWAVRDDAEMDRWWPTHLADSPVSFVKKPDTIEQKWLEMREVTDMFELILDDPRMLKRSSGATSGTLHGQVFAM